MKKTCKRCGKEKDISEFHIRNFNRTDGHDNFCKECRNEVQRIARQNSPAHKREMARRQAILDAIANGKKICTRCGKEKDISEFGQSGMYVGGYKTWCKQCCSDDRKERYAQDREHELSVNRKWTESHREVTNAIQSRYRTNHRESVLAYLRENAKKHRRERIVYMTAWRKANPKRASEIAKRARAKKRGRDGAHTFDEFMWIVWIFENRCPDCGRSFDEVALTEDHIDPDGSDYIENIQPLCLSDNSKKGNRYIKDFRPQWLIDNFQELKSQAGF